MAEHAGEFVVAPRILTVTNDIGQILIVGAIRVNHKNQRVCTCLAEQRLTPAAHLITDWVLVTSI